MSQPTTRDTTDDNPEGTAMTAYTITLAESKRGKYHLSGYEPPLVLHDDDPAEGVWTTFWPLCKAPPKQRDTPWSSPTETAIIEVWRTFVQKLHSTLACEKCERASWSLMKLELLEHPTAEEAGQ